MITGAREWDGEKENKKVMANIRDNNLKNIDRLFLLVYLMSALILAGASNSFAQFSGIINYSFLYDNNPFKQPVGNEEYINSVTTNLNYRLFEKELYLFYSGNLNAFQNISDRFFQYHSFGANYAFSLSDGGEENIFLGANYDLKRGTSDYRIYDYNQFSSFINGKFSITENVYGRAGYKLTLKNFPSLYDLTHFENLFFGQVSTFLETKTGLFLNASLGNKNYSMTETITSSTGFKGNGKGYGSMMRYNQNENNINVLQLRTSLKISQSLFENTGMSVSYLNRLNLNKLDQNLQSTDFIYSDDQDLWDDPYGFQSNEYGIELTQRLPFDFTVKLSGEYARRHFTSNLADSLNLIKRVDGKSALWFGISKIFQSMPVFESFEITVEYMFINNESNMFLFNYKNNMAQLGLEVEF
jgi:hypothetical protein